MVATRPHGFLLYGEKTLPIPPQCMKSAASLPQLVVIIMGLRDYRKYRAAQSKVSSKLGCLFPKTSSDSIETLIHLIIQNNFAIC